MKRTPFKIKPLKRTKLKKPKKKTPSQLKKQLDKIFSIYVRQQHSKNGYASCYTCGARKPWQELQCGHFVSRSHLATRYSEENCRPQCAGCNIFGGGRIAVFGSKLESELGAGTISRLYQEAQKIVKNFPYEEKIEYYKSKLTTLT